MTEFNRHPLQQCICLDMDAEKCARLDAAEDASYQFTDQTADEIYDGPCDCGCHALILEASQEAATPCKPQ